jgi:thioredoxin reductase/Fe-S-cluster-containing dehydrogenase component/CRP-like cAMP-binding protein
MSKRVKVAVVGGGPAGLSCAAHAAELGVSHVLLEGSNRPAHTIYRYQKGKHVMAEPTVLPLRSPLPFSAAKREEILAQWYSDIRKYRINVKLNAQIAALKGQRGAFEVVTAAGRSFLAEHVVLSIGTQGNLRKLDIPGESPEMVQYQLDDADAYCGETIVVIGAGDSAVENALALARNNRVILVNRADEFARCKQANLDAVLEAIRQGAIKCHYATRPLKIEAVQSEGKPALLLLQTPQGQQSIACDRVIARLGATSPRKLIEGFGVRFSSEDPEATPLLSPRYESSIPGVYVIGMLGGAPLIKQALNQGYEAIEHILGRKIEPADQPLLAAKFQGVKGGRTVPQALTLLQRNMPLLAELTELQLRELMLESKVHMPEPDHVFYRKGIYSSSFYSIIDGEVWVELENSPDGRKRVALSKGKFFGELGLLSGRRRLATVRAGEGCLVIETPRRTMLKFISSVEGVRRRVDAVARKRAVRMNIAPSIPEADLDEMVGDAELRRYAAGDALFEEGDTADGLHLIRRGSVMISRLLGEREVVVSYLGADNYVGVAELLSDAKRSATVRAAVATETILLKAASVKRVLARNTALRKSLNEKALSQLMHAAKREDMQAPGNLISFLVQQGMGEATDMLVIDSSLCVRCGNCETACSDTHGGTSRLHLGAGPTFAYMHVPTSCRHCENPQCMKDCPPDAIHRSPNGEVYIQDTCIGCGNCERNCPYDVIQLAPAGPAPRRPNLLLDLLFGRGSERDRKAAEGAEDAPQKAVKCDMCKGLAGGAACVRACPTGAAIRMSPERFTEYTGS